MSPITDHQQWLIDMRIACPEAGYPVSEARYVSFEEYLQHQISEAMDEHERDCH